MKKCPKTLQWIGGTQIKGEITAGGPCIGSDCAAYCEGEELVEADGTAWKKQWMCGMAHFEVWHDVEEK